MEEESVSKFRILVGSVLIVSALALLPFLLSALWMNPVQAASHTHNSVNTSLEDSPNMITRGAVRAADRLRQSTDSTTRALNNGFQSVTKSVATASVNSGKFVAHSVNSGVTALAHGTGSGVSFVAHTTSSAFGLIAKAPGVSAIIKPADKVSLPVINPNAEVLAASQTPTTDEPATKKTQSPYQSQSAVAWPIHGAITTEFGVPHWPFQPIHTGLDISDGAPSGITPIHAFKRGVVIAAIHSSEGFGNHVIVDHGGGLVSLYGHLASISVRVGQVVDMSTVLGHEGSTGASTGTHLHFEIQLNGQPVNPHKYVNGLP